MINFKINSWKSPYTFIEDWEDIVDKYSSNVALQFEDTKYTFKEVNEKINQISNWAIKNAKFQRGSVVALIMKNRPEFVFTWLAMAKIGVITALINTNLHGISLEHVLKVSGAQILIYGSEVEQLLYGIDYSNIFKDWSIYYFDGTQK